MSTGEAATGTRGHLGARAGEPFAVELHADANAGYRWRADFAEAPLALLEQGYRAAGDSDDGAGLERFVFVPHARGECRIRFTYGRAWETTPSRSGS